MWLGLKYMQHYEGRVTAMRRKAHSKRSCPPIRSGVFPGIPAYSVGGEHDPG